MLRNLFISLIVVSAAGCNAQGNAGAGVTAGSEAASTVEKSRQISRQKQMQDSNTARATAQMPAQGLIAEALGLSDVDAWLWKEGFFLRNKPPVVAERDGFRQVLAVAVAPVVAWEVDPMPDFSDLPSRVVLQRRDAYLRSMEVAAIFSNSVFAELAEKVAERPRKDPDQALEEIRKAWQSFSIERLGSLYSEAIAQANGRRVVDLTGKVGVHWVNPQLGDFKCEQGGCTLTKNGIQWFGGGKLNGNEFTIALESSTSTSTSKSKTLDQRQSGSSVQRQNADVSVK